MFNGTLGTWNTTPVELELKDDAKPVSSRTYPVWRVHKSMFKKEVGRLVNLGVLEEVDDSKWGHLLFTNLKQKRIASDF